MNKPDPTAIQQFIGKAIASDEAQKPRTPVTIKKRPHVGILIGNAHYILFKEIERLVAKVDSGVELSPSESVKFSKYVDSLAKLAREEREQDREDNPSTLTDAELVEAARKILGPGSEP